jgi:DNA (cytosine-5)-methyltransferase 1
MITPAGYDLNVGALGGWNFSPAGLLIPPPARPQYDLPVGVGLFAGAGGMDLGCHQAGFHMAAAVEIDPTAALTYLVNLARPGVQIHFDNDEREERFTRVLERHLGLRRNVSRGQDGLVIRSGSLAGSGWISSQPPDVRGCEHFFVADCRNLTGKQILDALGLERGQAALVCGGPPCQGFSKANSNRSVMDPRNSLVFEFARLVLEIRPKSFIMENVPQVATMLTPEGVPVIDALARVWADGGFSSYDALKASLHAQFGVGALQSEAHRPASGKAREAARAGRSGQLGLFGPGDEGDEDD